MNLRSFVFRLLSAQSRTLRTAVRSASWGPWPKGPRCGFTDWLGGTRGPVTHFQGRAIATTSICCRHLCVALARLIEAKNPVNVARVLQLKVVGLGIENVCAIAPCETHPRMCEPRPNTAALRRSRCKGQGLATAGIGATTEAKKHGAKSDMSAPYVADYRKGFHLVEVDAPTACAHTRAPGK